MTPLVVDTDVVSFVFKGHALAPQYIDILAGNALSISFMTLAELRSGAARANWGARRVDLLESYLSGYEVVHTTNRLCREWGLLVAEARAQGRPIEAADAWIAATARMLSRPLVTHNRKHFDRIDQLKVISTP